MVHAPRPYLVRNQHVVDASDVVIACPRRVEWWLVPRSGTAATIRMAERAGRPVAIVLPTGAVTHLPSAAAWAEAVTLARVQVTSLDLPRE